MLNRPQYIALSLVLLLVLIVLNLPSQTSARVKLAIGSLFLPLFGLAGSAQQLTEKTGNAIVPRSVLQRQAEQLQTENQQLRLRAAQSEGVWQENNRLRALLSFQKNTPWKLKLARVLSRDPANWWRTIQIDLGNRDGIRADLPVLTAEGLVGRVSAVAFGHAQVVLVGDHNCRVAALVQETRDNGIIAPGSPTTLDPAIVELSYLARASLLKPGQKVLTSGLGGIFPKGIPIGEIVDVRPAGYGLFTEARVKLAVNLDRLEEVWVMLP